MSNTVKAGRRERYLARRRPSVPYSLPLDDDTDAVNELAAAKDALDTARFRDDSGAEQAIATAEKRLEKARTAVAACYDTVTLTAMLPKKFEALVAEHPAREGEDEKWNAETFPRVCFLACIDDDFLTPEEWGTFVDERLSQGEREALFLSAVGLNARWPSGAVPNV
jgi:hypothetical protein